MKFNELKGEPFEAVSDDNLIRISENEYIFIYEVDIKRLENIYNSIIAFQEINDLDLQLNFIDDKTLLVVKLKSESGFLGGADELKEQYSKINQSIKELDLAAEQLDINSFTEVLCNKLFNERMDLENINAAFNQGEYNKEYLKFEESNYFTILSLSEYPSELDLREVNKYSDISINCKFTNSTKTDKIYNLIKERLETKKEAAEQRVNLTANKPVYPYKLEERLNKLEEVENWDLFGLEINLLVTAKSKDQLEEKVKKIKESIGGNCRIGLLANNIKKDTLFEVLPANIGERTLTPAFYNEGQVRFLKNIKQEDEQEDTFEKILNKTKEYLDLLGINVFNNSKSDIPIKELYQNGVFELDNNTFSAIFEFKSVNYLLEKEERKDSILEHYQKFINIINENINTQIYIKNRDKDAKDLEEDLLLEEKKGYENYIRDYNTHLKYKIEQSVDNSSDTEYYLVLNLKSKSVEEATEELARVYEDIKEEFEGFNSELKRLSAKEVEGVLFDSINREGNNHFLKNDYQSSIAERVAPISWNIKRDHLETNRDFKKCLYVNQYPNELNDEFLVNLINLPFDLEISLHISASNPTDTFKKIKNKTENMEQEKFDREDSRKNSSTYIPFELENDLAEGYYILNKLKNEDQKLFSVSFYITIFAESKKELDTKEKVLKNTFAKNMFEFNSLYLRQKEGLKSTLPFGVNFTDQDRILLTENLVHLQPFSHYNLYHEDGFCFGLAEDDNPLVVNRKNYDNTSAFILGVPGSGKSLLAKLEILDAYFNSDDDIIIIDPEREFGKLTEALGGELIELSTSTNNYINIMKLPENTDLTFEDEVKEKIEFLITFIEKLTGEQLTSSEKSILDRCLRKIYQNFRNKDREPVLNHLYNSLKEQNEKLAKELALKLEIFIEGSLDIFASVIIAFYFFVLVSRLIYLSVFGGPEFFCSLLDILLTSLSIDVLVFVIIYSFDFLLELVFGFIRLDFFRIVFLSIILSIIRLDFY